MASLTGCCRNDSIKVKTEELSKEKQEEVIPSTPINPQTEYPLQLPDRIISPEPEYMDSSQLVNYIFAEQNRILIDNLSIIGMCALEQKEKEVPNDEKKEEEKIEIVQLDKSSIYYPEDEMTINYAIKDKQVTIIKVQSKEKDTLILPDYIEHKKVTCIDIKACEELNSKTIVLPEGLTTIKDQAFYGNEELVTIELPSTLTYLGDRVFGNCSKLKEIQIDSKNKNFCVLNGVLYNQDKTQLIRYPAGIRRTSFTIPKEVISIENGAFSFARYLTYVIIPESVHSIGEEAFAGCLNVDLLLPKQLKVIGEYAFADCNEIRVLTIPKSILEIQEGTFTGCSSLTKVTFLGDVRKIGFSSFANCSLLKEIIFNGGGNIIEDMAFAYCPMLLSVELPEGTKQVGDMVFYACKNLRSVQMPKSIEYIGNDLFIGVNHVQIVTESGSNAETYASENGIPYREP